VVFRRPEPNATASELPLSLRRAEVNQRAAGNAAQVIAMLDDLGRSIDTYAASLDDAAAVRRDVLAVNHGKRGWRLLLS
jgi:hypothetical protein